MAQLAEADPFGAAALGGFQCRFEPCRGCDMTEDLELIARARGAATGATVHGVGNLIGLYRMDVLLASQARDTGRAIEAERWELSAARWAYALERVCDGLSPKDAEREAKAL